MAHFSPRALEGRLAVSIVAGVEEWNLKVEVIHPDLYGAGCIYLSSAEAEQLVDDLNATLTSLVD